MSKNILEEHPERPACLWISFDKPHPVWTPPERFLEKFRDGQLPTPEPESPEFYACVEYMDHVLGLVLDLLEQHGLVEDTVLVYTSDHGEMLGHNGLYFKSCFYEPAVHVPCIMRFPGVIPPGQVVGQITELIDIMPTLLDYAGIPPAGAEEGCWSGVSHTF